jgi:hypothetical protein
MGQDRCICRPAGCPDCCWCTWGGGEGYTGTGTLMARPVSGESFHVLEGVHYPAPRHSRCCAAPICFCVCCCVVPCRQAAARGLCTVLPAGAAVGVTHACSLDYDNHRFGQPGSPSAQNHQVRLKPCSKPCFIMSPCSPQDPHELLQRIDKLSASQHHRRGRLAVRAITVYTISSTKQSTPGMLYAVCPPRRTPMSCCSALTSCQPCWHQGRQHMPCWQHTHRWAV